MRLVYLLFLFVFAVPFANAAVIYGNAIYSGDNFTTNIGGKFMMYGVDPYTKYNSDTDNLELFYKGAFISSDVDESVSLKNGTCYSTKLYKYCFKYQTIDMGDVRSFKGDYIVSKITISIENVPKASTLIRVDRSTNITTYCNVPTLISIIINNSGETSTNITYQEILPENVLIVDTENGDVKVNTITFKDILGSGMTKNYSYTLNSMDCKSKSWNAKYSFSTDNGTVYKNLTNLFLSVDDIFKYSDSLSEYESNYKNTKISYNLNMTNLHPFASLNVELHFTLSDSEISGSSKSLIFDKSTNSYEYNTLIPAGQTYAVSFDFIAKNYSTYAVSTKGTVSLENANIPFSSGQIAIIKAPDVRVLMKIINLTNTTSRMDLIVENNDLKEKYYYIYGFIKGLGDLDPIYLDGVSPNNRSVLATIIFNSSILKDHLISFDGVYRDKNSFEYKLHAESNATYIETEFNLSSKISALKNSSYNNFVDSSNSGSNNLSVSVQNPNSGTANINIDSSTTKNDSSKNIEPEKDILTKILESLNDFLQSIFG